MKKLFLTATLAVLGLTTMNAQEVNFGAKAGVNIASLKSDNDGLKDLDSKTSFHVGVMAELKLSDKFAVQPELLFSSQGAKEEQSVEALGIKTSTEANYDFNYLNLPVMAKYYVTDGLSLEAGPQVGFLMSAKAKSKIKVSGNGANNESEDTEDLKDTSKSIDFGLNFGAGYKLENGLSIGARYNLGLSNIADTSKNNVNNDTKIKNGVIQVSVGYFF